MKFAKKIKPEIPPEAPKKLTHKEKYFKHPRKVKRRAYELYMMLDETGLARRYSFNKIADIIKAEFAKEVGSNISKIGPSYIANWATHYGWKNCFNHAMERAKAAADTVAEQAGLFNEFAANTPANITRLDALERNIAMQTALLSQVEKMGAIASTVLLDMFMLNQAHYKNLMRKTNGEWHYDCNAYGRRKQLFDMWLAGTNKMLEVYNLATPKHTTTRVSANGDGTTIDQTTQGGVPLAPLTDELVLRLFGAEQVKGGFGNELPGPNNADFPSEPRKQESVTESKAGADTQS